MSGILGSKQPAAAVPTQLNSINVDQSKYGLAVSLIYGVQRVPLNLAWYGAFFAQAVSSGGSGKGGHSAPSSYNYEASWLAILGEGPITGILEVWKDKDLTNMTTEGLTLFTGAGGQAPWSYLTSSFPTQAVPYDHTCYVAVANFPLGGSAALPNYTFEVQGFLAQPGTSITFTGGFSPGATSGTLTSAILANGVWDITFSSHESRTCTVSGTSVTWDSTLGLTLAATSAAIAGGLDGDPSAILLDYCTDANHGANFNAISSTIQGTGPTTWQTYCKANYLMVSPLEDTQRAGTDFLKDLLEITNSNGVMSAGTYYITPYGDSAVSANGASFSPNLTPLFAFTDDDFMPNSEGTNDDPVVMTRKPLTETYNVVRIEYLDRGNSYNTAIAEWTDPLDQALNGIRVMSNKTFHQICDTRVAANVAALIGQRQLYIRNTYTFTVRADYSLLEPMDLVSITDANLGITNKLVRITETQDDENDLFTIHAEEMFVGTASAPKYNFQPAQGYAANFAATPVPIDTPVVFTAPPALVAAAGGYELWIAAGPSTGGQYGGCSVFASMDGTTYGFLGSITGQARYGTASAVTATATSITLTLAAGAVANGLQLTNASAADYAANRALIWLDGEIIGFENVTLVSSGVYTLSPISRGLFGTGPSQGIGDAHSAGASWARLDETIFKFAFDPGMIGQTIDLKLPTFNTVQRSVQSLSAATAYAHLITATSGAALIGLPLKLIGRGVTINGTNAFKSASTTAWDSDVYSLQGYTNGAFVSFQPAQANQDVVVGLNSDPTTDSNYTSIDWGMNCNSGGDLIAYASGAALALIGTYAVGDVLTVSYDGAFIRWLQNGVVLHQVATTSNQTLYLDSSFNEPGTAVNGLTFGPYGTATPVLWVPVGNCLVSDENVTKQGGSAAWDSGCYSISGYGTCHVIFKANDLTHAFMVGLAQNPILPAANNYTGIDFALYCDAGSLKIYEAGTLVTTVGAYAITDLLAITYDGATITYWQNSVSLRTVSISGKTYYSTVAMNTTGSALNSLEFGPGSVIPLADTAEINLNAATSTLTGTLSGSPASFTSPNTNGSVTVGPFPVATTVILTVTGQWQFTYSDVSPQGMSIQYGISTTTETFSGALVTVTQSTTASGSAAGSGPLSQEISVSLAANTTTTYNMLSGQSPTGIVGTAITISGIIKVEVIKR
jgi:hypothetical protein